MADSVTALMDRLTRRWRHIRASDPDRGSTALWLAIVMVALLAMAGLVLDGGAAIAARGLAADTAQQAARAGADALSVQALRSGTGAAGLVADPVAADRAARAVLEAAGIETYSVSVAGNTVTVTARAVKPTAILSAIGIDEVRGGASATAEALLGTTTTTGG